LDAQPTFRIWKRRVAGDLVDLLFAIIVAVLTYPKPAQVSESPFPLRDKLVDRSGFTVGLLQTVIFVATQYKEFCCVAPQ
jgi:hypothetical protein